MNRHIVKFILIPMLLVPLNPVYANKNLNFLLKGNYAFTALLNCLNAPNGGFNANGQPVNPQNSILVNIHLSGNMNFDGSGTTTQNGNFVETEFPGSALNTTFVPGVGSGTYTIAPAPYSVSSDLKVTVNMGQLTWGGSTGVDIGFGAVVDNDSGTLTGKLSLNGTLVLTTAAPLIQTVNFYAYGNLVATFPRRCSLSMTLTPGF